MAITYAAATLDNDDAWVRLAQTLGGDNPTIIDNILRHLRVLDAKSYVIEDPYIDRDYSADYLHFYARTFRTHERHCERIHFFSEDVCAILRTPLSTERLRELHRLSRDAYCGFCVIRPLPNARIGRTVLSARVQQRFNTEATVTCRAEFDAHLLGVSLGVTGTSFVQQDSRVGACAQVAIWTGMRHMHARYKYRWISVADITRFARPAAAAEALALPAASDRLTSDAMVRAIAEAGYQPLCFGQEDIGGAILPYVESGIPVILGLDINETLGHAVTVVGRVFGKQECPTNSASDYIPAYIVHDDQSGPYMWLPMGPHSSTTFSFSDDTMKRYMADGSVELNVQCHAVFAIALMPTRVYSTAADAELAAWDRIDDTLRNMAGVRRVLNEVGAKVNERLLDELESAHSAGEIVLRTYLTSAAGYRRHLVEGSASDGLKNALLQLHLPHFAWITEISTIGSYNNMSAGMRRMYGHTVLDATSTGEQGDDLLVLHLPGLLVTSDVKAGLQGQEVSIICDDRLYECREKKLQVSR